MSSQVSSSTKMNQLIFVQFTNAFGQVIQVTYGDVMTVFSGGRLRVGFVRGMEIRTNGDIKYSVDADNYNDRDKKQVDEKIIEVNHIDSKAEGGNRGFFNQLEVNAIEQAEKLTAWAIKTGQYAPGGTSDGIFMEAGQTKASVIDGTQWTRGLKADGGQIDTQGPGAPGSPHQPPGQGANNQISVPGETPTAPQHGGSGIVPPKNVSGPGGTTQVHEADIDGNFKISEEEKANWEARNPGKKIKKGEYGVGGPKITDL